MLALPAAHKDSTSVTPDYRLKLYPQIHEGPRNGGHVQFAVIPMGPSVAVLRHGIGVEAASGTAGPCMTGMVRDGGSRPPELKKWYTLCHSSACD